ncbi:hypothetical protein BJY04DRAFT_221601 [Aspergillus karnatakaensis]|uniref:uncharacterized protein n=1 Tax=Aspergillus karnatakaensis TaxID=1810916 RepID=UPI003CCC9FF9
MSSPFKPSHPSGIHTPPWDATGKRPIVDGKYNDPITGEIRTASGDEYAGPPSVDIIITNTHESSGECMYRTQRPFAMEKLLCWMMRVVGERGIELDSVVATEYAIRIVLEQELDPDGFYEVADVMANGIWDEEEKEKGI